ncbi:MAG: ATP-binding cassette domain-containing protein [Rickettsiales bacterium TMED289]|nr:MAG: ATP-binding cassette domain-containing protein [Rickettsiales bacterium TMED289]|tara:strand:- start:5417 stop:6196 length:780 start_codon:yes stop_codon:yes gene_type:complete
MAIIKKFYITKFKKERPKIELKNISLSFNKREILENVSLTIREGEICGILGPNGVGKSTIFNIIVGLVKPDYGDIFIDKKKVNNIPIYKRALDYKVSIVPQAGGIFSDLTCYQNLKAISDLVIKEKKDRNYKIEKMISKFELDAVKNVKAKYLSGGQKKRVCIAMALLSSPKIVLMDEPFQGLDLISTRYLQETIVNLQTEDNSRCCIISDHAARDLLNISDRAVILANKKIVAHGPPKDLLKNEEARNLYFGETFNIN